MSQDAPVQAIQTLLDWAAQLCLTEVDAPMRERLCSASSRTELLEIQPDLEAWMDLPEAKAIEEAQEAYAATFLLPKGAGLRLTGYTQGDTERLGPALADELARLLVALDKGPDASRYGKLPSDHAAIALSALAALVASTPRPKVVGLDQAHFVQALQRWAQALSVHPNAHPLYRAVGQVCNEMIAQVLDLFANAQQDSGASSPVIQLPVLQ